MITMNETLTFIEGWGIRNPDPALFTRENTGREYGYCFSRTCHCNSHSPIDNVYRLRLNEGTMTLAYKEYSGISRCGVEYYLLPDGRYLEVEIQLHYYDTVRITNKILYPTHPKPEEEERGPTPGQWPRSHRPPRGVRPKSGRISTRKEETYL